MIKKNNEKQRSYVNFSKKCPFSNYDILKLVH